MAAIQLKKFDPSTQLTSKSYMLIVGEPATGKTTLMKELYHGKYRMSSIILVFCSGIGGFDVLDDSRFSHFAFSLPNTHPSRIPQIINSCIPKYNNPHLVDMVKACSRDYKFLVYERATDSMFWYKCEKLADGSEVVLLP